MRRRPMIVVAAIGVSLLLAGCGADAASSEVERAHTPTSPSTASPTTTPPTPTSPTTTRATTTTTVPGPGAVAAAAGPAALADRLVTAERITRDPGSPAHMVRVAAFELQQLYRQLGRTPEWDAAVLADAPPELHHAVSANAAARREFRSMHRTLSDTLPAWRIVDPPPAADLLAYYREGEASFGVPWEILAAVNLVETGFGRIRGTSIAGAQGPMQFMPATWEAYGMGGDIDDPHDAVLGAANYLAANGGGSGDLDNALWHYNHSDRYVRGVQHVASVLADDPNAFTGYYHWQVVYLSTLGDVWLPTGYEQLEPVAAADYLAANADHHLDTATS